MHLPLSLSVDRQTSFIDDKMLLISIQPAQKKTFKSMFVWLQKV